MGGSRRRSSCAHDQRGTRRTIRPGSTAPPPLYSVLWLRCSWTLLLLPWIMAARCLRNTGRFSPTSGQCHSRAGRVSVFTRSFLYSRLVVGFGRSQKEGAIDIYFFVKKLPEREHIGLILVIGFAAFLQGFRHHKLDPAHCHFAD